MRVDLEQHLPFLRRAVVADADRHDRPTDLGRDLHEERVHRRLRRIRRHAVGEKVVNEDHEQDHEGHAHDLCHPASRRPPLSLRTDAALRPAQRGDIF